MSTCPLAEANGKARLQDEAGIAHSSSVEPYSLPSVETDGHR
ncbi:MAG: hypothetical protein Q8N05_19700 [Bacteroidota bacterium]|nr:hypothetical protein [Bacteroidota bacterium]